MGLDEREPARAGSGTRMERRRAGRRGEARHTLGAPRRLPRSGSQPGRGCALGPQRPLRAERLPRRGPHGSVAFCRYDPDQCPRPERGGASRSRMPKEARHEARRQMGRGLAVQVTKLGDGRERSFHPSGIDGIGQSLSHPPRESLLRRREGRTLWVCGPKRRSLHGDCDARAPPALPLPRRRVAGALGGGGDPLGAAACCALSARASGWVPSEPVSHDETAGEGPAVCFASQSAGAVREAGPVSLRRALPRYCWMARAGVRSFTE